LDTDEEGKSFKKSEKSFSPAPGPLICRKFVTLGGQYTRNPNLNRNPNRRTKPPADFTD
jgi:hypothetical protein